VPFAAGTALSLGEPVPHAGRRSVSLLDWAVELLLLGAALSQISAAPWRQGQDAVHRWREANGGLLHTSIIACGWMFGGLVASYVAEFLLLFVARGAARPWLPVAVYSPVAFCWLWRRSHA